jgi:hypothetical protein
MAKHAIVYQDIHCKDGDEEHPQFQQVDFDISPHVQLSFAIFLGQTIAAKEEKTCHKWPYGKGDYIPWCLWREHVGKEMVNVVLGEDKLVAVDAHGAEHIVVYHCKKDCESPDVLALFSGDVHNWPKAGLSVNKQVRDGY